MPEQSPNKNKFSPKPPREGEIVACLQQGELNLPPATLRLVEQEPKTRFGTRPDGVLEAQWQDSAVRFVFDYKGSSTPKALDMATAQVIRYSQDLGLSPLVIVPFLSEEHLRLLEAQSVSGLDLSGNGVLMAPGFFLWRSGSPNRFKDNQPIKNVYRGVSSLFTRCFLLRQEFSSLMELREFALSRLAIGNVTSSEGTKLVKSTASKVVQTLEEEQIVSREADKLRLTDPKRLLRRLRENYNPSRGARMEGKTALPREEIWRRLRNTASPMALRAGTTGLGSAGRYGVLSGPERISLYVTDLSEAADLLEVRATRAFSNIDLIEETEDLVYFDARENDPLLWASPIQTWLELATGGPREQDAAQMLEAALIGGRAEEML